MRKRALKRLLPRRSKKSVKRNRSKGGDVREKKELEGVPIVNGVYRHAQLENAAHRRKLQEDHQIDNRTY